MYELITLEQPFKGNSLIELAESIFANKIPDFNAPKHIKLLVKMYFSLLINNLEILF